MKLIIEFDSSFDLSRIEDIANFVAWSVKEDLHDAGIDMIDQLKFSIENEGTITEMKTDHVLLKYKG
jgi:hypothetical protein